MHSLLSNRSPYKQMIGVGGIGTGIMFGIQGEEDIRREESRPAILLDVHDYCKLHIICHYIAGLFTSSGDRGLAVLPVARLGDDANGRMLYAEMLKAGLDCRHVILDSRAPTLFSVCFQYSDGSGGNITSCNSAASLLSESDLDAAEKEFCEGASIALAVPEAPLNIREEFLRRATRHNAFRVGSFAAEEISEARERRIFDMLDLVVLNRLEAGALLGMEIDLKDYVGFAERASDILSERWSRMKAVITVGAAGAFAFDKGEWTYSASPKVPVASTAGAGDALTAGILAGIIVGMPFMTEPKACRVEGPVLRSALDFGIILGSFSVTSPHTIHPGAAPERLLQFAGSIGCADIQALEVNACGFQGEAARQSPNCM